MDDLPNIHWRTERNVGLKPMSPRMAIVDVFVLTACCAVGMAFSRWNFGENNLNNDYESDLGWTFFGMTLMCLFSGLLLGCPMIMALHFVTGRRSGPLTFGEVAGLVPGLSILTLVACAFVGEAVGDTISLDAFFVLIFGSCMLLNLGASILAMLYIAMLITNRDLVTWTSCLGTASALVPGAIVLLFCIVLILNA
ncbi:MAG: hypothetical protein SGJ19_12730 [Planctomycetia bacterium]|nr:hypothetical protein [Planctomycetia bacterium]